MTPTGIEPATFRFVTQHLNHCATAVPLSISYFQKLYSSNKTTADVHTETMKRQTQFRRYKYLNLIYINLLRIYFLFLCSSTRNTY